LLRALVESPELHLRVLTGEDALDQPVGGVFTTDLLDPSRYLSGGEIVLTGLMWRRTPQDSRAFVSALAGAGVTALAAGDAALGSVPPDLVEACRDHRLPLIEVPVDVSFGVITERVMRASLPAGPGPAAARLRLLTADREPADAVAALLAVVDAEYGVAGWVLSATGRLVAGAGPVPAAGLRSALARAGLGAPGFPATVTLEGAPFSLFGVAGPSSHRLACWFVALAGEVAAWDEERRAVAAELAGLVAGQRARHEDGRRAARRSADAALHQLLEWRAGHAGRAGHARRPGGAERGEREIAAALRRHGLAARGPFAAVAVAAPRAGNPPGAAPAGTARPSVDPPSADLPGAAPPGTAELGAALAGTAEPGTAPPGAAQPGAAAPGTAPSEMVQHEAAPSGTEPPGVVEAGPAQHGVVGSAVAQAGGPQQDAAEAARVLLEEILPGALVGVCGATAVALASGAEDVPGRVRDAVGLLAPVPGLDLPFGVSALAGAGELDGGDAAGGGAASHAVGGAASRAVGGASRAVAEARQASRLAELLGAGVHVVDSAQFGSCDLLLAMVPGEARRAFRAALLDPLLAYDRDHGTELVRTLEIFLACSGSWSKAADAMFVHVNSLRYRIRRIGELTGRDPGSLEDQAALLLALRIAG
jgi:hypothetical protein